MTDPGWTIYEVTPPQVSIGMRYVEFDAREAGDDTAVNVLLTPIEARLFALKLIESADEAEAGK